MLVSGAEQAGLCFTLSETAKTFFLKTRLKCLFKALFIQLLICYVLLRNYSSLEYRFNRMYIVVKAKWLAGKSIRNNFLKPSVKVFIKHIYVCSLIKMGTLQN